MNAPLTLPHGLTPAALNGEAILRALAGRAADVPFATQADLAKAADRAPKNIGREIGQLAAVGLVHLTHAWSRDALTEAGRAAIVALDRAAAAPSGGVLFVPPALLDDNPLNPRKTYDADKLEGLADTIEADGRVIEPLSVSPVQPNGRRFIWAGHRRKRAAMIVEARFAARGGELPPGLAQGVPCVEREATEAESLFIAVVENGQRENLSPWEEARALAALADATGWSGRELARKTGLAPRLAEGDETGVRDVQEKIKVARTAPAELVEAHESGAITWEQLRGALRTGAMPAPPAQPSASQPSTQAAEDAGAKGDASQLPLIPEEAPAVELNPRKRLILLEIAHAARFHPDAMPQNADNADGGSGFAAAGKYWLDMDASGLQSHRLIDFKHQGRPYVRVTPKGVEWMVENIAAELEPAMRSAQLGVNPCFEGPGYVTDWLNPPPLAEQATPTAHAAAGAAEPDADAEAAAAILATARDLTSNPDAGSAATANTLAQTGAVFPFSASQSDPGLVMDAKGECVCVVDVDGRLPDDQARARALIIATALNRACGAQVGRD